MNRVPGDTGWAHARLARHTCSIVTGSKMVRDSVSCSNSKTGVSEAFVGFFLGGDGATASFVRSTKLDVPGRWESDGSA